MMWGWMWHKASLTRKVLVFSGALGLGGCGFQPLYGSQGVRNNVNVGAELKQVFVANIPTRFGQELRLNLQKEMAGDGPERPQGYILRVSGSTSSEAVDIHTDNTSGRTRTVGWADWHLYSAEQTPRLLAEGNARTLDGYNLNIEQYFAQSLDDETLQQRVAQNLAHDVTMQVAIWFKSHSAPGPENTIRPGRYPDLDDLPGTKGTPFRYRGLDGFPAAATGRINQNTTTKTGEDSRDLNSDDDQ